MRTWAYYTLAFLGGLAAAWAISAVQARLFVYPGSDLPLWRFVILPPLGGVAGFALIYGLFVPAPLGLMFWMVALITVMGSLLIGGGLIYSGVATVKEASVIWLITLFLSGRWLVSWVPQEAKPS